MGARGYALSAARGSVHPYAFVAGLWVVKLLISPET